MSATQYAPYEVEAYNASHASENKIHDDTIARRFGFAGGLVPGVEVYGYMTHFPLAQWGRAWLERGTGMCRLLKPVYDGRIAVVTAKDTADGLEMQVDSEGVLCATGQAGLPAATPAAPALTEFLVARPPAERPKASTESLPPGKWLGTVPLEVTREYLATYLGNARETNPLYAEAGLVHPGIVLRICNWAISQNVVTGAWIHAGSTIQNLSAARVGDVLTGRARVVENYDRKGHKMVDLDVLVVANERTPVARVAHTAIYQPRQVAA